MGNVLAQLRDKFLVLWNKFNWIQRIVIGLSALVVIVLFFLLTNLALQPDYQPLWETNIDPAEAASITAKLDEEKIQYKLEAGGARIMVPAKDRDTARILVAGAGLPTGGVVGFESMDKTRFGETESDRRARFMVMLQGELTRTIESIPEVEKARVHIVTPQETLFVEKEKDATAALWLKINPGKKLQTSQVQGIVQLVSSSVEGLKKENITILDTHGNLLSEDIASGVDGLFHKLSATQMGLKQQFQKEVERSIGTMLDEILGKPGKAVVRVNAELDFDRVEKKTEDFGETTPRSTETEEETSTGTGTGASGTPGTGSNIPGYAGSGTTTSTETSKTHKVVNNEVDKVEEHRVVAQGAVKKISVAVVIDGEVNGQKKTIITDAVRNAAGVDEKRGDTISVAAVPFDTKYAKEMEEAMSSAQTKDMAITYGGGALALIILFVLGRKLLKKMKLEEKVYNRANLTVEELIHEKESEMTPEERERVRVKQQVEQVAKQNPADAAQLLKTWLAEE